MLAGEEEPLPWLPLLRFILPPFPLPDPSLLDIEPVPWLLFISPEELLLVEPEPELISEDLFDLPRFIRPFPVDPDPVVGVEPIVDPLVPLVVELPF